jgi:hypothetical protein
MENWTSPFLSNLMAECNNILSAYGIALSHPITSFAKIFSNVVLYSNSFLGKNVFNALDPFYFIFYQHRKNWSRALKNAARCRDAILGNGLT